jgi:hypothetical protein
MNEHDTRTKAMATSTATRFVRFACDMVAFTLSRATL